MSYSLSQAKSLQDMEQVESLLCQEGIRLDRHLDYTCALYDENYRVIATGSCFENTLRCFAVSREYQGKGLLNEVITHLIEVQAERGNFHLFLYTKCASAPFFHDLGFYEIARVDDTLVFMENRRNGFATYLKSLDRGPFGKTSAIVMNANPFTLGHQYLVEKAAAENDTVHLFVVSEDVSLVPFDVRKRLVRAGTAHLHNVILHDCGPYLISSATFPSYFLKDETAVMESQARLDAALFLRIAQALGIQCRYLGDEPISLVTGIYNKVLAQELPAEGIECVIIPRRTWNGTAISASILRRKLKNGDWTDLKYLVPETTLAFLRSEEAEAVLKSIRLAKDVEH